MKEMNAPSALDRTEEENQHFRERLIIAFIALLLISGFIIAVRLYTKLRIVRNLGPEDVCILCAYVCHSRLQSSFVTKLVMLTDVPRSVL